MFIFLYSILSVFVFLASDLSGSPPGDYAQEVPVKRPGEKQSGPPILPPHLLQVILNKDTPAHVSQITNYSIQETTPFCM